MLTAQQGANKFKQGVQGGSTAYTQGVQAVTENPAQKAIAQKQKMIDRWLASVNGGKWEQRLGDVTLAEWKAASATKGASNYAASADKAYTNYMEWAQTAYPVISQISQEIQNMPSATFQDNINRMLANVNAMRERLG